MNTNKLLILAAVGVGAYLLLSRGAIAATPGGGARPGTYSPIYPAGYGAPTAPNNPRAQTDALNNSTLYGLGRLLNGVFGGNAGTRGGAPYGTQPSAVPIGSGGGRYRPSNDYGSLITEDFTPIGSGGGQYRPSNDYGSGYESTQPDAYADNPPGGYDISTAALYSDDMYGSWD